MCVWFTLLFQWFDMRNINLTYLVTENSSSDNITPQVNSDQVGRLTYKFVYTSA